MIAATKKATKQKDRELQHYLEQEYPMTITPDEEGGFVAEIKLLPGCITQGETIEEVIKNIDEARRLWIEFAFDNGNRIPLPFPCEDYSGKFMLRLSPNLHKKLAESASEEGLSLNKHVIQLLEIAHQLWEVQKDSKRIDQVVEDLKQSLTDELQKSFDDAVGQAATLIASKP